VSEAPRTPSAFVEWLVGRHSDLAPILDEHLRDNGELLPHVFFGDVTRYASDLARRGDTGRLDHLLTDLDQALTSAEDEADNLIWASFVENAQGIRGDDEERLREELGRYPNLADALSHYE
jgi:hypothetical protein